MIMNPSLLPADSYIVINKSIITEEDKKILNKLYLPITGAIPIMLYNRKRGKNNIMIKYSFYAVFLLQHIVFYLLGMIMMK